MDPPGVGPFDPGPPGALGPAGAAAPGRHRVVRRRGAYRRGGHRADPRGQCGARLRQRVSRGTGGCRPARPDPAPGGGGTRRPAARGRRRRPGTRRPGAPRTRHGRAGRPATHRGRAAGVRRISADRRVGARRQTGAPGASRYPAGRPVLVRTDGHRGARRFRYRRGRRDRRADGVRAHRAGAGRTPTGDRVPGRTTPVLAAAGPGRRGVDRAHPRHQPGISVDSATDVAKDAADVLLLEKDLGVLADGVAEGRRIFANTVKYVLMGTSSNFGNMFSAAGASAFLPFLPMLPSQILLNNLIYDLTQVAIPADRVDDELLARPAHWHLREIRRFMLTFGPVSSLFDFLTFAILLGGLHAGAVEFRSGWFVESLATQTLVVFVIR